MEEPECRAREHVLEAPAAWMRPYTVSRASAPARDHEVLPEDRETLVGVAVAAEEERGLPEAEKGLREEAPRVLRGEDHPRVRVGRLVAADDHEVRAIVGLVALELLRVPGAEGGQLGPREQLEVRVEEDEAYPSPREAVPALLPEVREAAEVVA